MEGEFNSSSIQLAVAANGVVAAVDSNGAINLWNPPYEKAAWSTAAKDWEFNDIAITPDGKLLATASFFFGLEDMPAEIAAWDPSTGKKRLIDNDFEGSAHSVAITPDGNSVASSLEGESFRTDLHVYDLKTGKLEKSAQRVTSNEFSFLGYSSDGKQLIGAVEHAVIILNAATGKPVRKLVGENESSFLADVAISSDDKLIAAGNQSRATYLWDADTGKLIQSIQNKSTVITSVAFSPDGSRLVTGTNEGVIRFWKLDPPAGKPTMPVDEGVTPVARTWYSADKKYSVEATIVSVDATNVVLKAVDGRDIKVPISVLSAADQAYLRERK